MQAKAKSVHEQHSRARPSFHEAQDQPWVGLRAASLTAVVLPRSYPTAWRTIQGYETMHMIRKGQVEGVEKGNIQGQNEFIAGLFGLAA